MNVEELVRESLREQADDGVRPPAGFADRVLTARRRRRTRTIVGIAVATTAVLAAAVAVPALDSQDEDVRPASDAQTRDVIAHPDQSPPRDLIAAGNTALAAFYTTKAKDQPNGDRLITRTYGLLDQKTGKYEKAPAKWAWIDVAPGMRTAAVLEGELPARRIGVLDLITGKVERWIPVKHPVAGVSWSPDGSKLVATAYSKNPDRRFDMPGDGPEDQPQGHGSRTGFYVVDAASGDTGTFRELTQKKNEFGFFDGNPREDLSWSHDGKLLYVQLAMGADGENRAWYTLKGGKAVAPAAEKYAGWPEAGLSPDGKLLATDGNSKGSAIRDPRTGKEITKVPGQQLLAWADNKRIIAWGCDPAKCGGKGEFRNQLLLVTVGSKKAVPLSDFRKASATYPGRWSPLFAAR